MITTNHKLTFNVCCAGKTVASAAELMLSEAVGRNLDAVDGVEGSRFLLNVSYPPLSEEEVSKNRSCFIASVTTTDLGALEIFENQARQALAFLGVEVA